MISPMSPPGSGGPIPAIPIPNGAKKRRFLDLGMLLAEGAFNETGALAIPNSILRDQRWDDPQKYAPLKKPRWPSHRDHCRSGRILPGQPFTTKPTQSFGLLVWSRISGPGCTA